MGTQNTKRSRKTYYAYLIPDSNTRGVTEEWDECEKIVSGKSGARFKGFKTKEEALTWLDAGADWSAKKAFEPGVYFDAGTGRNKGVEISVTDENGESLLGKVMPKKKINRYGKHWIFGDASNNYGELLALSYALEIALNEQIKRVFGDSKLILDYWSKGFVNKKEVSPQTVKLAFRVKKLREEFEKNGGTIVYISGGDNPADLGFHR